MVGPTVKIELEKFTIILKILLFIDHAQNGTQYIYTIHMEHKHVHTKQIHTNT